MMPSEIRAMPAATEGSQTATPEQAEHQDQRRQGQVAVADMPAVQVQVGVEKDDQAGRQRHLGTGPVELLLARRDLQNLVPETEIDGQIGQNRPCQHGGRGEHDRSLDHEEDGQEQGQKAGNAQDDAAVERVGVDRVLVDVRLPQPQLRQAGRAHLDHIGDDCAGIERDQEDIRLLARLALRGDALARRDRGDPRGAEIRPDQLRSDKLEKGRHDQAVDLFVTGIGQREDGPARIGIVARVHLDAPDDPVGAGRGRDLQARPLEGIEVDRAGQVHGVAARRHLDGLDGARRSERV